jgi:hypothetical protein
MTINNQESVTELEQMVEDLHANRVPATDLYSTIVALGKAEFMPARPEIERYLSGQDEEARRAALEVLVIRFGGREQKYWEVACQFVHAESVSCRITGISILEMLKRNTNDPQTLSLLAPIVQDTQERKTIRKSAYTAMRGIQQFDPMEQAKILGSSFDLDHEIDWAFVEQYLS